MIVAGTFGTWDAPVAARGVVRSIGPLLVRVRRGRHLVPTWSPKLWLRGFTKLQVCAPKNRLTWAFTQVKRLLRPSG